MFRRPNIVERLSQGDIIDNCPVISWECSQSGGAVDRQPKQQDERALVLTQTCDLDNEKTTRVQFALVHDTQTLVDSGILKAQTIRENVRLHRVFGWYFLEESDFLPESIVDLRDLHTIDRIILDDLVARGHRLCTLETPYREHLAQHFGHTYSRIALPAPAKSVD